MMMAVIGWTLIVLLMIIGMAGAFVPILPGALAILLSFFVYGLFFTFDPFGVWFWLIQGLITLMIFVSDYVISAYGVKVFGGSKRAVTGSIIGVIAGPFVIPAFGIILGPLIGAIIGEWTTGTTGTKAVKAGVGAVLGMFSSSIAQALLQLVMIIVFAIWIVWN